MKSIIVDVWGCTWCMIYFFFSNLPLSLVMTQKPKHDNDDIWSIDWHRCKYTLLDLVSLDSWVLTQHYMSLIKNQKVYELWTTNQGFLRVRQLLSLGTGSKQKTHTPHTHIKNKTKKKRVFFLVCFFVFVFVCVFIYFFLYFFLCFVCVFFFVCFFLCVSVCFLLFIFIFLCVFFFSFCTCFFVCFFFFLFIYFWKGPGPSGVHTWIMGLTIGENNFTSLDP